MTLIARLLVSYQQNNDDVQTNRMHLLQFLGLDLPQEIYAHRCLSFPRVRKGARVAETCQRNEDGPTRGRHYLELASVAV